MRIVTLLLLVCFVIGCQSPGHRSVISAQGFGLIEAGALKEVITVWQTLKLTTKNGDQFYNAVLDVSEQTTQLALFSPLGHRMATAISANGSNYENQDGEGSLFAS